MLANRLRPDVEAAPWVVEEVRALESEILRLRVIRCPDGTMHRWNGDGQCKECGNYATDLIDAALVVKDGSVRPEGVG